MEGHKEGTQETALRMIQNSFDMKMIYLCTGLTSKEVKELQKKTKTQLWQQNDDFLKNWGKKPEKFKHDRYFYMTS